MTIHVIIACVRCGSDDIKLPDIQAPHGHAFDAKLMLVTCGKCGLMQRLSEAATPHETPACD